MCILLSMVIALLGCAMDDSGPKTAIQALERIETLEFERLLAISREYVNRNEKQAIADKVDSFIDTYMKGAVIDEYKEFVPKSDYIIKFEKSSTKGASNYQSKKLIPADGKMKEVETYFDLIYAFKPENSEAETRKYQGIEKYDGKFCLLRVDRKRDLALVHDRPNDLFIIGRAAIADWSERRLFAFAENVISVEETLHKYPEILFIGASKPAMSGDGEAPEPAKNGRLFTAQISIKTDVVRHYMVEHYESEEVARQATRGFFYNMRLPKSPDAPKMEFDIVGPYVVRTITGPA